MQRDNRPYWDEEYISMKWEYIRYGAVIGASAMLAIGWVLFMVFACTITVGAA